MPRLAGARMDAREMLVAGQRVADQDGVRCVGVQDAIGLVRDLDRCQHPAAVERQRTGQRQLARQAEP